MPRPRRPASHRCGMRSDGSTMRASRRWRACTAAASASGYGPWASSRTPLGFLDERVRAGTDSCQIVGRRARNALLDELLAARQHCRPRLGVLAARLQQAPQPAAAVLGVEGLVGPVELHVDLARRVAHLVERGGALALPADV